MNRILLLEDDVSLIDGLVYSLKKNEFDVEVARTVCEAKQYLSELDRYDLLILDVTLPDGTGFDVCERVRKENQQIPIIFLTASDEEVSIIRGLDSGGDDYITKPFNVKILIARCSNLIKTRQQMLERLKQPIANKQEAPDTININDRQLLEKATQIIKENFENPEFDMNLLASELGMGRSKLYTKLKEITGLTPNEFTLKLKLEEAMHLLNNAPHLNVTEISYQLGFSSARYFSKCFKTFYGIAPLNVRKNANPPAKEE